MSVALIIIDPVKQIQKARDTTRENDLKQLSNALDSYYNDTNCFPASLSSLGSPYIRRIPQDPEAGTISPYAYITDSASCPQWSVLFAKISFENPSNISCALENITNCVPVGYANNGYNYCIAAGSIGSSECASIRGESIP